jgi:hypothetical protein
MFPSAKTRFASAARRGFDLAIEFATLGEYALASAAQSRQPAPPPPPAAADRPLAIRARPSRVKPASAAARRLQPPQQLRRISIHSAVRELAFDGSGASPPARGGRKRAGAAKPRPQRCLVAEAGVRQP